MHRAWKERPREEAYAFNPAFLSSLECNFVLEYTKAKHDACPMSLVYMFPALSLHGKTRQRLPGTIITSLYQWIQQNEDVLVDLPRRTRALLPLVREGTMFALHQRVLILEGGRFLPGEKKGHFTPKFIESLSEDMSDAISCSRFLARWFAKSGAESSILSAWGIKP